MTNKYITCLRISDDIVFMSELTRRRYEE